MHKNVVHIVPTKHSLKPKTFADAHTGMHSQRMGDPLSSLNQTLIFPLASETDQVF